MENKVNARAVRLGSGQYDTFPEAREAPDWGLQVPICLGVPEDDDRDDGGGQEEQVEAEEQGVHHVAELHPQANQMLLLSLVFLLGPS